MLQHDEKKALTIRLDPDLLKMAENQCAKRNVSMNTFVNQIFRNYKDWSSIAGKAGLVPVDRELLISLLENIDEKKLLAISNEVVQSKQTQEKVIFFKGKFDSEACFQVLELWLEAGGFQFKHEVMEEDDGTLHTFCMQFNMGRKFSLFMSSKIDNIFRQIGVKKIEFQTTDGQVAFKVKP